MVDLHPSSSVITLNANEPNAAIKRQRLSDWVRKVRLNYKLSKRDIFWIQRHR